LWNRQSPTITVISRQHSEQPRLLSIIPRKQYGMKVVLPRDVFNKCSHNWHPKKYKSVSVQLWLKMYLTTIFNLSNMPTDVQFYTNATECQLVCWHFVLSFRFYNHYNKYTNNVLFAFVFVNSPILSGHLLDILKINWSTKPSLKLPFVYIRNTVFILLCSRSLSEDWRKGPSSCDWSRQLS
jgi:hypothetical protein